MYRLSLFVPARSRLIFSDCFVIRLEDCLELLCNTGRYPEAAFMARTYLPSEVSRYVKTRLAVPIDFVPLKM